MKFPAFALALLLAAPVLAAEPAPPNAEAALEKERSEKERQDMLLDTIKMLSTQMRQQQEAMRARFQGMAQQTASQLAEKDAKIKELEHKLADATKSAPAAPANWDKPAEAKPEAPVKPAASETPKTVR